MEGSSLCSSAGMMEYPGPLSKGDLGPCHCHYLVHSQNYKVSVGGCLCMALLWQNLIGGGGNR